MSEKKPLNPLEEIRKYREELAKRFDYDLEKLGAFIKEEQAKNTTHKVITKEDLEKAG